MMTVLAGDRCIEVAAKVRDHSIEVAAKAGFTGLSFSGHSIFLKAAFFRATTKIVGCLTTKPLAIPSEPRRGGQEGLIAPEPHATRRLITPNASSSGAS